MKRKTPKRRGRKPKPTIKPADVRGAKYLEQILDLLRPLHSHCPDPKRRLHFDEYCAWLLLYFFTPIVDSMRGLQQVSDFKQFKRKLGLGRFSLGSFSEAGNVFDPALLEPIIEQIAGRLDDIEPDERLRNLPRRPTAVDGTLLHALPKMVWALCAPYPILRPRSGFSKVESVSACSVFWRLPSRPVLAPADALA